HRASIPGSRLRRSKPVANQSVNARRLVRAGRGDRQGTVFERESDRIVCAFYRPLDSEWPRVSRDLRQRAVLLRIGGVMERFRAVREAQARQRAASNIDRPRLLLCVMYLCVFASYIAAQNREVNWPMYAGDAQRSGWQKTETRITKGTARDLQLLWKLK